MSKTLTIGSVLPDITLRDQNDQVVRLHDFIDRTPLVIYFYPKDETPGCIAEACSFRDQFEDFESAGAKVFGISGDSVKSHFNFAKRLRLKFLLLSDVGRKAEKVFGVERNMFGLIPGRVTFVFDKKGKLQYEFSSAVQVTKHITEALTALKKLAD
ncbi:MAG: peroxiredoxin Q/BCP [Cyclobacteriaceae bacterium]|jgi:peroxiredoxin Q/BCP